MPDRAAHCSGRELAVPWLTIPAMLADNLRRYAHRTAIVDGDMRITYAELAQRVQALASGLRANRLCPGEVVAIWAPNSWQWVASAVACWWMGCAIAPIPARGRILDALPILQATRASMLLTCSAASSGNQLSLISSHLVDANASLQAVCPHLRTVVDISSEQCQAGQDQIGHGETGYGLVDSVTATFFAQHGDATPSAQVSGEDVCTILFTSGSTGRPKGVPRRHGQVLRNRWASSLALGYTGDDRLLVVSEFSHTLGLHGNLLRCLMLGATLVIAGTRNPGELATLMRAQQITAMGAPPSLFAGLMRERMDGKSACNGLRLALTGAADIPPALVHEMISAGIGAVVSGYGMTECDTICSTALSASADTIANTVGLPEAGQELQISDASGAAVGPGVEGEIWIRGYSVSPSYLGAEGQLEPAVDAQGWLHSGDMGCFTSEGYLRILGRMKEVITIHGYTLYPAEIESLLSRSGMLAAVSVVGAPHAVAGEICVAFIVPADASTFSLKRLRLWARGNMADYKIPGRFVVLDSLPLNHNGKVDRLALKSNLHN